MAELIVLGSASAVPTMDHENTHFVLRGEKGSVLVDCSGSTWIRLQQAGIKYESLNDIILTHCHPDHISGIPSFLMNLWLMGRKELLRIYGLPNTLDCVEKMMALFEWDTWPDFFPVAFHRLTNHGMMVVLENQDFRIFSSPVRHIVPTIGLRIESVRNGRTFAYSCDTEPCEQVVALGRGVDILLHEATGASYGHSSAAQAGEMAQAAGAQALYFIHYPPELVDSKQMVEEAQKSFSGEIKFAKDLLGLTF